MVACSIGRHDFQGRRRPVTAPGKGVCGFWPRPSGGERVPHFLRRHALRDLGGAHVARFLDHALHREHAEVLVVVDRGAGHGDAARVGVDDGLRRHAAQLQRGGDGDRLHGRARLEHVGHRAVAQLFAGEVAAVVRVVARVVGHGEQLARLGIDHHHAAGPGLVGDHGIADLLVGHELHAVVDAQLDVVAVGGRHLVFGVLDDVAQAVLDDMARARLAGQLAVEGQLDAFLPDVLDVGEARQVRGRLALGVLAPVVAAQVDALDAERGMICLPTGGVDLALDPDEALVLVLQLLVELLLRHAEQPGRLLQLGLHGGVVALDVLGNGPDAGRRNVGREDQPVAVEDAAAVRGQLQRALVAHLALVLEEVVVEDLYVGGPAGQQHEAEGDAGHDELAAPDGGGLASSGLLP
jgi:hypothetical protein